MLRAGTLLHCMSQAHRLATSALACDDGNRFLVSGGGDCLLKLWTQVGLIGMHCRAACACGCAYRRHKAGFQKLARSVKDSKS